MGGFEYPKTNSRNGNKEAPEVYFLLEVCKLTFCAFEQQWARPAQAKTKQMEIVESN